MKLTQFFRGAWNIIKRGGNWEAAWHYNFNRPGLDMSGPTPVRRPYEQSVWVRAAIQKIAQPIGSVPLRFEDEQTDTEIEDERLEAYWSKPAVNLSWFDTVEATVGWLNLAGEAFWLFGDEWNVPFPQMKERLDPFVVVRPDRMEHMVYDGALTAWKYTDKGGRSHLLDPAQVVHFRFWNPYDDYRGLAPYLAAKVAAEADYYASLSNRNLWEQSGDTGPYIIAKTGMLTVPQQEQILSQLREKRAAAARGQFKGAFLTSDVAVEDPKIRTMDANAVSVRLANRHEIAIAFGIPPSMFDVIASYSIGSASDRFILIEETCMPTAARLADAITEISKRMIRNDRVCAYFDWDEHSTMQAVRRERIGTAFQLWQMGQPMETINEYLQLGLTPYPGWDTGFLSFSLAPVDSVANPEPTTIGPDDDFTEDDEADEEEGNLGASMIRAAFKKREDFSEWQSRRPKRELAQVRMHQLKQDQIAKKYYTAFNRVLMSARSDTLKRLSQIAGQTKSIQTRAAATDIVFDRHGFRRMLVATMRNVSAAALDEAGQTVMDEMEIRDPWKTPPGEVLDFNKARENKIVGAADDVFRRINNDVEESIKAGESIDKMANRIKGTFNDISKGRAKTIARTEMGAAYGQGRQVAMESAGVQYKEWLTSGLPNVRPAHVEANGQRVRVTDKFNVGGEQLDSPGDPRGSAENVINCNCIARAVAGPGEQDE